MSQETHLQILPYITHNIIFIVRGEFGESQWEDAINIASPTR